MPLLFVPTWAMRASIRSSTPRRSMSSTTRCGCRRYNFFQPVMRMIEKSIVPTQRGGHRVHRVFDDSQTPFERLRAANVLPEEREQQLLQLRDQTNPRQLRREIYQLLDKLLHMPGATGDTTEDVYMTLAMPAKV